MLSSSCAKPPLGVAHCLPGDGNMSATPGVTSRLLRNQLIKSGGLIFALKHVAGAFCPSQTMCLHVIHAMMEG